MAHIIMCATVRLEQRRFPLIVGNLKNSSGTLPNSFVARTLCLKHCRCLPELGLALRLEYPWGYLSTLLTCCNSF